MLAISLILCAVAAVRPGTAPERLPPLAAKPTPLLLARATRIARVDRWEGFILYLPEYHWISSHEVMYFEKSVGNGWKLNKLDIRTGVKTPLTGLSRAYNETLTGILADMSPDGKRLLWASSRGDQPTWVVANLDGSERTEWRRLKVGKSHRDPDPFAWSFAHWTNNGRTVMESSTEGDWLQPKSARLSIKEIEPNTGSRPPARIPWSAWWHPRPSASDSNLLLGLDDFTTDSSGRIDDYRLLRVRLSRKGSLSTEHIVVHLPSYANLIGAVPSPNGDRIAWEVGSPYYTTGRGANAHGSPPRTRLPLGFWVSFTDGTGLRPIGYLRPDRRGADWQYQHLGGLRWTPDGKRLSFVYAGVLYSVSAQ